MKLLKELFVFDFDETLVKCDRDHDEKTRYEDIKIIGKIEPMFSIFRNLVKNNENVVILTNRTEKCKYAIAEALGLQNLIVRILTRSYCLSRKEIDWVIAHPEELEEFLYQMDRDKIDKLTKLAKSYENIYFFDDLKARYEKYGDMVPENVHIFLPVEVEK